MYQEKLDMLLDKYAVPTKAVMEGPDAVTIDGTVYRLLSHRFERRFTELRKMMRDGTLTGVSGIRCGRITDARTPLAALIRRELDICRFLSGHEVVSVAVFANGDRAATLIAVLDNEIVCSLEVANTLPDGASPIDKHEVISARGFICDRVVDTQIPQQSIYLYAGNNETYTDVDFELYGMPAEEVAAVRAAFALAKDGVLRARTLEDNRVLDRLAACAEQSAASGRKVIA